MMNVHYPPYTCLKNGVCATIGFFDGLHNGHAFLLEYTRNEAKKRGLEVAVITFEQHPRKVIHSDYQPALLYTLEEKLHLLQLQAVDHVYILEFDEQMAQMNPETFMNKVLKKQLNVKTLIMGYDHRFGHNIGSTADDYLLLGQRIGIEILKAPVFEKGELHVSSTTIRKALSSNDIKTANLLLGHPYTLSGVVVQGRKLGRQINFPTANIKINSEKLIPAKGVYGGSANVEGKSYRTLINIGNNPSISDQNPLTVEAFLFDFNGSLYGQTMRIDFELFIRHEQKFENIEQLRSQIEHDCDYFIAHSSL